MFKKPLGGGRHPNPPFVQEGLSLLHSRLNSYSLNRNQLGISAIRSCLNLTMQAQILIALDKNYLLPNGSIIIHKSDVWKKLFNEENSIKKN